MLVPVGSTRTVEFVADEPGDWAMHRHMTHHVVNPMGHDLPNMIGIDPKGLDAKINPLLPEYVTTGEAGMGGMGEMGMPVPKNSIPMVGGKGPPATSTWAGCSPSSRSETASPATTIPVGTATRKAPSPGRPPRTTSAATGFVFPPKERRRSPG